MHIWNPRRKSKLKEGMSVRNTGDTYSNLMYSNPVGTRNNNCYAWAINYYKNSGDEKLQPGDLAGLAGGNNTNCDDLVKRALADAEAMGWSLRFIGNSKVPCCNGYKIVAVVAPGNDFHFYRFNKDLLYRIKTPRSLKELAKEFGVSSKDITIPGAKTKASVGDLVLIKNANVWSHKRGLSEDGPLLKDACGRIIKDPAKACRDYGNGLNYSLVCGAFCFKKKP